MAGQGLWDGDLDLIVFGFFVGYRYDGKSNYTRKTVKSHRATLNLIPLDRAKVSDLSMRC